ESAGGAAPRRHSEAGSLQGIARGGDFPAFSDHAARYLSTLTGAHQGGTANGTERGYSPALSHPSTGIRAIAEFSGNILGRDADQTEIRGGGGDGAHAWRLIPLSRHSILTRRLRWFSNFSMIPQR